ncbi:connector enhancer of ksr isoform X4 [Oratosquilla oratoria]|uniref:connector enhancer of ksr isoform X4 n=1 Tax=Oratosquilla oratoria TaxID=337810 RepID=UPI003F775FE0
MAYVNVAEWSPDQVSEWLKGLDDAILPYIRFFINNGVDGKRLLQLSPDDLPSLCLTKIGHQEIVLQGVELVRNIHYQLHQENVQYLALRLSSKARSIYNELRISFPPITCGGSAGEEDGEEEEKAVKKQERVPTTTIAGVAEALSSVKGLVSWLNRSPFEGIAQYDELKARLVDLSVRLATISRRDIFAENQGSIIRECCRTLAELSDKIIQDINDPLIIQPASLDVATIKKKADDDWGVLLHSSYHGIHQVSGVRALSPAHQCGKLQLGDELVQVNYQTVVGWTPPKLAALMQENPVEVILTVKKRPRHSNTQHIYFKPFRLPSKKRTYSPWGSSGLSSPRYDLQNLPNLDLNNTFGRISVERKVSTVPQPKSQTPPPALEKPAPPPAVPSLSDTPASDEVDSEFDDDPFLSDDDTAVGASSVRLYHPKPRIPVQRRATIPGATNRPTYSVDELLIGLRGVRYGPNPSCEKRLNASMDSSDDVHIRSGSGSEQRGLRPYTCIGTEKKQNGGPALSEKLAQMKESVAEESEREEGAEKEDKKVVNVIPLPPRQPASHLGPPTIPLSRRPIDSKGLASETTSLNSGYISKGAQPSSPSYVDISPTSKVPDSPLEGRSLWKFSEDRPKLDKSHSTPAYDMEGEETVSQLNISRTSSNASSNLSPSPRAAGKTETRTGCGNRRISCRDLGQGDHQGWLYRRRDSKAFLLSHHWERRWFVLKKNILYGYRDKDAIKADSLVYLPGFHVYPAAADVKSKKFAFKIYHSSAGGATFYFACSTSEEMSRWMSQMGLSAISVQTQLQSSTEEDAYFSETDEELDERVSPSKKSPQNTPARVSPSKENEGHFWRAGSASPQSSQNSRGSPLGSLGSSLGALSSGKSQGLKFLQCSRDLQSQPVPTSSFRSYRRVREDGKCNKKSTSTSDLLSTTDSKAQTKGVHRKGSLRERIRNFPASLTMDRKKEIRQTPERSVSVTEMASAVAQRSYRRSTTDLHECGSEGREKEKGNVSATLMEENRSQESLPSPDALKPSLLERRRASEMERNALRSARRGSADGGDMQLSPVDSPLFQSGSSERVPHYMMPTRSSSKQNFSKPEMADLESRGSPTRGGKGTVSPPSSGRCSPFKTDSGRRGSTGDAKHGYERQSSLSSDYWHSSRRGSVDCLASSPPRVTSPPMSPTYSSSLHRRTAQGSSGSLAAGEEYREGSPEKLWINSLRSDSRMKGTKAEKKEKYSRSNADVDRLKKAALYHPPQLKGRGGDPMKAAFELNLDPSFNRDPSLNPDPSITQSTSTLDSPRNSKSGFRLFSSPRLGRRHHSSTSDMSDAENRLTKSPPNAVVSPSSVKTFLGSPKLHKTFFGSNKKKQEEKQLQQQQHLHHLQEQEQLQKQQLQQSTKRETPSSRPEVPPRTKFLSPSERTLPASSSLSSLTSLSSTPQTKARQVPNLTIRAQNEDVPDVPRTPLKQPTMGVSMIGKQRRTPGFVSPRDVFFSSPPSSPTVPLSPPLPPLLPPASPAQPPLLPHTHVTTLPPGKAVNGKPKGRLQVLPHYPGMEYPPVFEPGTYSLAPNTESPQQTLTSQGYSIPISTCNTIARSPYGSSPRLGHGGLHNSNSSLGLAGLGSYSSLPQQSASPTSDHTPLRRASPQSERGPARRSPPQSDVTPQGRPSPNSERGPTMRSPLQSDGVLLRKVSPQSEESLIRRSSPQSDGILVRRASPVPSLPTPSRSEVSIPPPRLLLPGPPVVPPSDDEEGWTEEGMLKTSGTQTESQA